MKPIVKNTVVIGRFKTHVFKESLVWFWWFGLDNVVSSIRVRM